MVTQTYIFRNLPKAIITDENSRGLKWSRAIEEDIKSELGEYLSTVWKPISDTSVSLKVNVSKHEADNLKLLLHNLHGGKLI
jgi:hypothetical protein